MNMYQKLQQKLKLRATIGRKELTEIQEPHAAPRKAEVVEEPVKLLQLLD